MTRVVARRRKGFTHDIDLGGGHKLVADEPAEMGGGDEGASPTRLLAASLAACTAITIEMYAERKEWDLEDVEVVVEPDTDGPAPKGFTVTIKVPKELGEDQRDRLLEIAAKCPVHRALTHETPVTVDDRVELL
jgi:putative redox protein